MLFSDDKRYKMKLIRDFIIRDFIFHASAPDSNENFKHSRDAELPLIRKDREYISCAFI